MFGTIADFSIFYKIRKPRGDFSEFSNLIILLSGWGFLQLRGQRWI